MTDLDAPGVPLEPELDGLRRQRLMSLAAHYLDRRPGLLASEQRDRVRKDSFRETVHSHAVTVQAVGVITEFASRGIPTTIIKGPALAKFYRVPTLRPFGDVDLVVPPKSFVATLGSLRDAGWQEDPVSRQPWPFFQRWCRESVNMQRADGAYADLHHRPSPWIWTRRLDGQSLARRAEPHSFGGVDVQGASLADNALIAAMQLITDHRAPGSKLLAWRDLGELASVDPVGVARRANDTALGGVVRNLVLAMPAAMQPAAVLPLLDTEIAHPTRLVHLLDSAARGAFVRNHMARLPAMNAIAYAAGTVVPSRSFLRDRYPDTDHRLLTWWRAIADGVRTSS